MGNPNTKPPKSFTKILKEIGHGNLDAVLAKRVRDVTKELAVHAEDHGKAKGELVLKLKLEVERNGAVVIRPEVTTKTPKEGVASHTFYVDSDENLTSNDPRQITIEEVIKEGKEAPIRQ